MHSNKSQTFLSLSYPQRHIQWTILYTIIASTILWDNDIKYIVEQRLPVVCIN